jgi:hypothetical protein
MADRRVTHTSKALPATAFPVSQAGPSAALDLPDFSVPLFLVAPEEGREQVIRQVNRPTFERIP